MKGVSISFTFNGEILYNGIIVWKKKDFLSDYLSTIQPAMPAMPLSKVFKKAIRKRLAEKFGFGVDEFPTLAEVEAELKKMNIDAK